LSRESVEARLGVVSGALEEQRAVVVEKTWAGKTRRRIWGEGVVCVCVCGCGKNVCFRVMRSSNSRLLPRESLGHNHINIITPPSVLCPPNF
jgi:hypothetical protein